MRKPTRKDGQEAMASAGAFNITPLKTNSLFFEISGTADLIQNRFSQKALEEMLKSHMGLSVEREKKKPSEVIKNAVIRNTDGRVCVPTTAIKKAMLTASAQLKGLKKTQLRTTFFVAGNSVPITYERMEPRMDMVKLAGFPPKPDVRFRPSFKNWKARLEIQFADNLNQQLIMELLDRAGRVGLCEWRPEKDGTYGTFKISRGIMDRDEWDEVRLQSSSQLEALKIPEWAMDMEIEPALLQKIFAASTSDEAPGEVKEVG